MEYKAYLKQGREGCDYTIGCAQTVISITANDLEDATEKLINIITKEYNDERSLESVDLYEINKVISLDVDSIYAESELEEEKKKEIELKERELLKILKDKYEH